MSKGRNGGSHSLTFKEALAIAGVGLLGTLIGALRRSDRPSGDVTMSTANENQSSTVERDYRALIVALTALGVILAGGIIAIIFLPGPVAKNEVDNASQNILAIAGAGFGAVVAVVAAYFGIKAANTAREDSTKAAQRSEIRVAHLAGAKPEGAAEANRAATAAIKRQGLD